MFNSPTPPPRRALLETSTPEDLGGKAIFSQTSPRTPDGSPTDELAAPSPFNKPRIRVSNDGNADIDHDVFQLVSLGSTWATSWHYESGIYSPGAISLIYKFMCYKKMSNDTITCLHFCPQLVVHNFPKEPTDTEDDEETWIPPSKAVRPSLKSTQKILRSKAGETSDPESDDDMGSMSPNLNQVTVEAKIQKHREKGKQMKKYPRVMPDFVGVISQGRPSTTGMRPFIFERTGSDALVSVEVKPQADTATHIERLFEELLDGQVETQAEFIRSHNTQQFDRIPILMIQGDGMMYVEIDKDKRVHTWQPNDTSPIPKTVAHIGEVTVPGCGIDSRPKESQTALIEELQSAVDKFSGEQIRSELFRIFYEYKHRGIPIDTVLGDYGFMLMVQRVQRLYPKFWEDPRQEVAGEFIPGKTLGQLVREKTILHRERLAFIQKQLAQVMEYIGAASGKVLA